MWLNPRAQKYLGGTLPYVYIASHENDVPGWRLFQAMSNGTADFAESRYEYAANNKPFYVKTAPTTIPAHATQIVELTWPTWFDGYGRIYFGLYYSLDSDSATKVFLPGSARLYEPRHTSSGIRDNRVSGYCTMKWVVSGFPTDGTVWRIFPCMRTDDTQDLGALEIIIGNGIPESSSLTDVQYGQLIMRGYPRPASWTEFDGIDPGSGGSGGGGGSEV